MIDDVTAVLVTRGDVSLERILATLEGLPVVIWDNSKEPDMGPYGQFRAAEERAKSRWIFFQDDDVVTGPMEIIAKARTGVVVCNMPPEHQAQYRGKPDRLMGFGSVFERALLAPTYRRYFAAGLPMDDTFFREPGRLFTSLNPCEVVDVPIEHLPWATAPNRLYRQPDHGFHRDEMRRRAAIIGKSRI